MSTGYKVVLLVFAAGFVAAIHWLLIGEAEIGELDDSYGITFSQARQQSELIWVDARDARSYEAEHYPDALHLSLDDWDSGLSNILSVWDLETPIVVYCDRDQCESSRIIAARLRDEIGVEQVYWLIGGWEKMQEDTMQ